MAMCSSEIKVAVAAMDVKLNNSVSLKIKISSRHSFYLCFYVASTAARNQIRDSLGYFIELSRSFIRLYHITDPRASARL